MRPPASTARSGASLSGASGDGLHPGDRIADVVAGVAGRPVDDRAEPDVHHSCEEPLGVAAGPVAGQDTGCERGDVEVRVPRRVELEPCQLVQRVAVHRAAPVEHPGDLIVDDMDVAVDQVAVDHCMRDVVDRGFIQQAQPPRERFLRPVMRVELGAPSTVAGMLVGDGQQCVAPSLLRRGPVRPPQPPPGTRCDGAGPQRVEHRHDGRQQGVPLGRCGMLDRGPEAACRNSVVAAAGWADGEHGRGRQPGAGEVLGVVVLGEILEVRAEADDEIDPVVAEPEAS